MASRREENSEKIYRTIYSDEGLPANEESQNIIVLQELPAYNSLSVFDPADKERIQIMYRRAYNTLQVTAISPSLGEQQRVAAEETTTPPAGYSIAAEYYQHGDANYRYWEPVFYV
jgi:hypothetical protein